MNYIDFELASQFFFCNRKIFSSSKQAASTVLQQVTHKESCNKIVKKTKFQGKSECEPIRRGQFLSYLTATY